MRVFYFFLTLIFFTLSLESIKSQSRYDLPYQRLQLGYSTSLEVRNGELFGAGWNFEGQLGDGTRTSRSTFTQIGTDDDWIQAESDYYRSYGLKGNGTLWAWGYNQQGGLGLGIPAGNVLNPTQMQGQGYKLVDNGGSIACALKADGTMWCWGSNATALPQQIGTDNDWVNVKAARSAVVALKANGTIWGFGWSGKVKGSLIATPANIANQITYQNPVQMFPGEDWIDIEFDGTFLAIRADGTLWSYGSNTVGQSGLGSRTRINVETQVGTDTDWVALAQSGLQSFALKSDGSLWGWGSNAFNVIAPNQPTSSPVLSPLRIGTRNDWVTIYAGNRNLYGLTADGFSQAVGYNLGGCFGTGNAQNITTVTPVRQQISWLDVDSRGYNSVALRSDGILFSAGLGEATGQGINAPATSTNFNPVSLPGRAIAISQGDSFTLALLADGRIAAFGNNVNSTLGNGNNISQNQAVIPAGQDYKCIAAGKDHGLAVKSDGSLWVWGKNTAGVLGLGLGTAGPAGLLTRNVPTRIGTRRDWVDVAAGDGVAFARRSDGSIWAWGDNSQGQIGTAQNVAVYDTPQRIGNNDNWVDVQTANGQVIGLQADGTVWVWGKAVDGIAGDGSTAAIINTPRRVTAFNENAVRISAGKALHAVLVDGQMRGWGGNGGAVGNGSTNAIQPTVANVVLGSEYPYPGGGTYGTQAINRTRSEIWYTGLNVNDVAGKPLISLADQFTCDATVLPAIESPASQLAAANQEGWNLVQNQPDSWQVHYNLEEKQITPLQLIDMSGRSYWQVIVQGQGTYEFDTQSLAPGVYVLRGGRFPAVKFVVH